MNFNNKADRTLEGLVVKGKVSGAGATWLKAATNPFYDTEDKVVVGSSTVGYEGMPNMKTEPSVNRRLRQQVAITDPFLAGSPTAPWDFMIVTWPMINSQSYEQCGRANNIVNNRPIGGPFNMHHVSVYCKLSSAVNFVYQATPDFYISVPSTYLKGVLSINYGGFELVNTTPELYRGGSLSCVRYSQPSREPTDMQVSPISAGNWAVTNATVQQYRAPPVDLAELNTYPNAMTWGAEKGIYSVYGLNNLEDMPTFP